MKYLSVTEARRLKEAAMSNRDRAIVGLLLHTGMRIGELAGLQVRDFDPEARTVRIERSVVPTPFIIDRARGEYRTTGKNWGGNVYSRKKPLVLVQEDGTTKVIRPEDLPKMVSKTTDFVKLGTKSKGAVGRVIPMTDPDTWVYVEAERRGRAPNDWMWRIGNRGHQRRKDTLGGATMRMTYVGLRDVVIRTAARAGIPPEKRHPHTLRHTFAVHFLSNRADLRALMRIGGWSSMEVVAGYLDLVTTDLVKVAEQVQLGY